MDKLTLLRRVFGYSSFRPGQEELIDGVLSGRDVFGIMPTGGGKSMCYQIPGLLLPGLTVVVSPLISLMQDQVQALTAGGIPAAFLNSSLNEAQIRAVYRNLYAGQYKLLYVTPERLDVPGFFAMAEKVPVSFLAVDEAHCISQWGQDFRPSYLRILNFIAQLPYRPVLGAFTATATKQVQEDVMRILKLQNPVRVVTGFDRPNLYFEVRKPERKDPELLQLMAKRKRSSGIIYCATRKSVETVCDLLKDHGYAATRYHAGLSEQERRENQEDFLFDRKTVMVATNAFGMGIDKSNVSFVIHYNMPKSMEAYYQEAGRAGRDGTAADCILLYSGYDVNTARFLINNGSENEELDDAQRELVRQQDLERLESMVLYCKIESCLRHYILEYFAQKASLLCDNCGNCREDCERLDVTREAQMFLSCVKRIYDKLGYYMGISTVGRTLRGSRDKKLLENGLDQLSTYGIMKNRTRTYIYDLSDHLEAEGYLKTNLEHKTLELTAKAGEVLFRGKTVSMLVKRAELEEKQEVTTSVDGDLLDILKELRVQLARKSGVQPYMIFSNATLADMAQKQPRTLTEFKKVSGVGEIKCAWYGKTFTERIKEYLKNGE